MFKIKGVILCLVVLVFAVSLGAQEQEIIWSHQLPYEIMAIHSNSSGNVVVAGISSIYNNGCGVHYSINTISQYNAGGMLLWSKNIRVGVSSSQSYIYELKINDNNEVIFYNIEPMLYLTNNDGNGIAINSGITKLSASGDLSWNVSLSSSYPGGIRLIVDNNVVVVSGKMSNFGSPTLPAGGHSTYDTIIVLNNNGNLLSRKYIYSNFDCSISSLYIENNALYATGGYVRPPQYGGPPYVSLYFENTIDGNTIISTLNEAGGNKYLARLDLTTNNWAWQRNIEWGNKICGANGNIYVYKDYNTLLDQYNASTGALSNSSDLINMRLLSLYTTIDNKLHFTAQDSANNHKSTYGTIISNLTVSEYHTLCEPYGRAYYLSNDRLGNIYGRSGTSFFKSGYPNPYIISQVATPITFNPCYPNMQYENNVNFVNIGNAPLSISEFMFTNSTPGLSAEVISGSPANSGESITIKINFDADAVGVFSDTLFVNSNSPYVPSYSISISGNVVAVPPDVPANVVLSMLGDDAQITWDAVTQSVLGHPLTPDYYFVYFNGWEDIDGPFYFLGRSYTTQYTHLDVGLGAEHMLYRVKAIKLYRDGSLSTRMSPQEYQDADNYLSKRLKTGISEAEVSEILQHYGN